jgi:hypothetical protein
MSVSGCGEVLFLYSGIAIIEGFFQRWVRRDVCHATRAAGDRASDLKQRNNVLLFVAYTTRQ